MDPDCVAKDTGTENKGGKKAERQNPDTAHARHFIAFWV